MPFVFSSRNAANNSTASASASASDAGFDAANILNDRLDSAWRAPTGASRWIKLAAAAAPTEESINFVAVVCPLGKPILGDCTIELLDGAGVAAYPAVTIGKGAPGMPDRRFMWTDGPVDVNAVKVTVPAGSYVARIVAGYTIDAEVFGNLIAKGWEIGVTHKEVAQNSARGVFLDSARLDGAAYRGATKRRRLSFELPNEQGLIFQEFDQAAGSREVIVMPRPALYTDTAANRARMQATSVYGTLPREIALGFDATSGEWNTSLEIVERI